MPSTSPNRKKGHALISDEPIYETGRKDDLRFAATAEVLAKSALYTPDPITIGVFGNWGSGKTSLMRLMMDVVKKEGQGENIAVPVWFNAWQYEREEHLIIPLLATIARDINKKEDEWGKISINDTVGDVAKKSLEIMKDGGKKIHDALRSVLYGLSMKGKLGIPGIGDMEISTSMKDMIERYEALTQDTLMARSLYFNAFDNLREISRDGKIKKPKIVVFVDDLDRCFPEQAVRLLESIKLVLHQPGFAFILGIYPEIIEEFIRNKYAKEYHFASLSGDDQELKKRMGEYLDYFKEYLGKIIQVRHRVPKRKAGDMEKYIEKLLDEADVKGEFLAGGISLDKLFSLISEVGKRNPREILRKLNGLIVKYRIRETERKDMETKGAKEMVKYDLLAMLINEVLGEKKYDSFRDYLEYEPQKNIQTTIGQYLAQAFSMNEVKACKSHGVRCEKLRELIKCEKSTTMDIVLRAIEKDVHLCNILVTEAGIRWLNDKSYRDELSEILKDEKTTFKSPDVSEILAPLKIDIAVQTKRQAIREIESTLVHIKAGTLSMGDGSDADNTCHQVSLKDFLICSTQVTQGQYEAIMGNNPAHFKGKNRPVENVSWQDAMIFCERLSKETGHKFSLPTEAQWEYACRAGSNTIYCFGNSAHELDDYAWYDKNSGGCTRPVRQKKPNAWGLYDMHGNVWEWCGDSYKNSLLSSLQSDSTIGPHTGSERANRGGGWRDTAEGCRSDSRGGDLPDFQVIDLGFRVVVLPPQYQG